MYEIKNLMKSFSENLVLDNINLEFKKGTVTSILGPSGTGKSTLLRCLNLLEKPDSGSFIFNGKQIDFKNISNEDMIFLRKNTAMVFQNFNLYKNKTAKENIMEPLISVHKLEKKEAENIAENLLKKVGLTDKANQYPATLSGGQQQRIGIARAVGVNAQLLLFDEPTSALDPALITEVLEVIKDLANDHNSTMIIVTHEISFAKDVSDQVVFMDKGQVIERATSIDFFNNPKDERTRNFLKKES